MGWQILWLVGGLALLVKGGELFVSGAVRIAEFLRMPRVVIGSTLVSLATTTPELMVSIMAGARGESSLAVGNAVGSVVCNLGLILGLTAALKHVDVHPRTLWTPFVAMFACGGLLFLMTLDLALERWQGILLLSLGAGYFAYDFLRHARDRKPTDRVEPMVIRTAWGARCRWRHTPLGVAVQFAFGAAIVVVGSRLLVDGAVEIAAGLGIPPILIGLTIVAIGTSLPELVTAVTSSRQAVSDLAVGNVLGANVANLTFIVGIAAVLSEVRIDWLTQRYSFPAMLVVMGLVLWMLLTDRRVTRREGVILLTAYGVFLSLLIALTLAWGR